MKITFRELYVIVTFYHKVEGKRKQITKKFSQTINPFNKNEKGLEKTKEEIQLELLEAGGNWLLEMDEKHDGISSSYRRNF